MCRLLRLLGLLKQLFVLSLIAPQRVLPLVDKPLPTWLAYLIPLLYLVAVFINFMACLWSVFLSHCCCCCAHQPHSWCRKLVWSILLHTLQFEMISFQDYVAVLLDMPALQQLLLQVVTGAACKLCREVILLLQGVCCTA